jgi:hypothetical protein
LLWHQLTDGTLPQVMHLLCDTGTVLLAVGGATLSIIACSPQQHVLLDLLEVLQHVLHIVVFEE